MRYANDFPGRDPTQWTIEFKTTDSGVVKEEFESKEEDPARFSDEKFTPENAHTVSEIKFIFHQNRYGKRGDTTFRDQRDDGINRMQLNYIGLYVPDPNAKKPEPKPEVARKKKP